MGKRPPKTSYARYEVAPGVEVELGWADPESLEPVDWNPRRITSGARDRLAGVLGRFGVVETLVVRGETGELIGGHQRRDIVLEQADGRPVPVSRVYGLTDDQVVELNTALNNPEAQGDMDMIQLAANLRALREARGGEEADVSGTGYSPTTFEGILEKWSEEDVAGAAPTERGEDLADDVRVECPGCGHQFVP